LSGASKSSLAIDSATLEQIEASSDGMVDLETAAMLMTDLHHKATAAMSAHEIDSPTDSRDAAMTPSGATLLRPSMSFPSGQVPLPQWDAFMPQSLREPKAHSISSSVSGSQDSHASQHSFTSVSTAQPTSSSQRPTIVAPQPINGHNLAPTLHPYSRPASGAGTPIPHSPYNYQAQSPLDYRGRSPGPNGHALPTKSPKIETDEERLAIIARIETHDSEHVLADTLRLPSLSTINRYLSTYFNLFHHHLPFLHPASFNPSETSPPLLLAVLSIGALYTFEQEQAYMLHIGSKVLVNQFLQNKENFSSRKCPLWTMQSTLLNMIFASWSGDPKGLEWACSIKSLLANMVAGNKYELKIRTEARQGAQPSREDWIEDEGCRRTYYAVRVLVEPRGGGRGALAGVPQRLTHLDLPRSPRPPLSRRSHALQRLRDAHHDQRALPRGVVPQAKSRGVAGRGNRVQASTRPRDLGEGAGSVRG
jgi:hypothetical protein